MPVPNQTISTNYMHENIAKKFLQLWHILPCLVLYINVEAVCGDYLRWYFIGDGPTAKLCFSDSINLSLCSSHFLEEN